MRKSVRANNTNTVYTCFFPTKTLIIDDNADFLNSISLHLPFNKQSYDFFDNPKLALACIENNIPILSLDETYYLNDNDESPLLESYLRNVSQQIYNTHRFNVVTNVVVDYNMPITNGLELCQKLSGYNINKILLTGEADEKLAVSAFNNGLIDAFIPKQHENVYEMLLSHIYKGNVSYFKKISEPILTITKINNVLSHLQELSFYKVFESILQANHIIEYYLLDDSGNFLMINELGNIGALFIISEEELNAFYQLALEEEVSACILNSLKHHKQIPCYFCCDDKIPSMHDYIASLHPATKLITSKGNMYYSYVPMINFTAPYYSFYHNINNKRLTYERSAFA